MEYSAVIQPPSTPCARIQLGTLLSIVQAQMTCVFPKAINTEPRAFGAIPVLKLIGRRALKERASFRVNDSLEFIAKFVVVLSCS